MLKTTTFRVSADVLARLHQIAAQESARIGKRVSVSELVRDAIEVLVSTNHEAQSGGGWAKKVVEKNE